MKQLNARQKMFVKPNQSVQKFVLKTERLQRTEGKRRKRTQKLQNRISPA
jgi:hypothetical protein